MFRYHNQKGSTLLLVLLTATIISIASIIITTGALNNTVQINKSESSTQSTSMAKMGLYHYYNQTVNDFNSLLNTSVSNIIANEQYRNILNEAIDLLCGDEETLSALNNCLQNPTHASQLDQITLDYLVEEIENNFDQYFQSIDYQDSKYGEDYTVSMTEVYLDSDDRKFSFLFTSNGKSHFKEEQTLMEYKFEIPFDGGVKIIYEKDEGDCALPNCGLSNRDFPDGTDIPDPEETYTLSTSCSTNTSSFNNSKCKYQISNPFGSNPNGSIAFSNNTFLKVTGDLTIPNTNSSSNSTLYVTGDFKSSNLNSLTNFKLHVDNNATVGSMNGFTNSHMEIKKDATFTANIRNVSNSTIYIGGNAIFTSNGALDLTNNSILYLAQHATISNAINVTGNSIICVHGNLTIASGGSISIDSNGNGNVYAKESNHPGVITDRNRFRAECHPAGSIEDIKPKIILDNSNFNWEIDNTNIIYK